MRPKDTSSPCFYCRVGRAECETASYYYVYGQNWGAGPVLAQLMEAKFNLCALCKTLYGIDGGLKKEISMMAAARARKDGESS